VRGNPRGEQALTHQVQKRGQRRRRDATAQNECPIQ
jgi:hypothetical protein